MRDAAQDQSLSPSPYQKHESTEGMTRHSTHV